MLLNLVNEKLILVIIILIISCYNLSNKFSGNCNEKLLLEKRIGFDYIRDICFHEQIFIAKIQTPHILKFKRYIYIYVSQ